MELSKEQIRLLLMHEWRLDASAAEAARRINQAWGGGTVGESTARLWFSKFNKGEESLQDKPRAGRPIEIDRQKVLEAIEENPSLTTRMLADEFECSNSTIAEILHELGKVWKRSRWVPHELTEAQKRKRVAVAETLLQRQELTPFLDNLITADEKWISFKNTSPEHEWLSPEQKPKSTPKKDFRNKKAMLCVFWSRQGTVHWELLEDGQTVKSELYCQQLDRVQQALQRHKRLRRGQIVFLDDNARPHRSRMTNAKVESLGWERLDHPPYSPDLAPSDFHLFRSLEHFLRGKHFDTIEEMRESLQEFFDSKNENFYRRGIDKLTEKWQEVIELDGEYLD